MARSTGGGAKMVTPALLQTRGELNRLEVLDRSLAGDSDVELCLGPRSVWLIINSARGARLALRTAYAPDGLELERFSPTAAGWEVDLDSSLGAFGVSVELDAASSLIGAKTRLVPSAPLKIPFWPRDLLPIDNTNDPIGATGLVHFNQRGPRSGLLYGSVRKPGSGTFLYLQDLTALNPYCRASRNECERHGRRRMAGTGIRFAFGEESPGGGSAGGFVVCISRP